MTQPDFDVQAAHRYFSAQCFNQAWDLMEKPDRTPEEDETMIRLSMASTWHWTQRPDCTDENLSVGFWQASRIYALLGRAGRARHYGQMCLDTSRKEGVGPFFLAYAFEALARAEMVARNREKMEAYRREALALAEQVQLEEDRQQLLADLETIG